MLKEKIIQKYGIIDAYINKKKSRKFFVFALMKCGNAAFGEQNKDVRLEVKGERRCGERLKAREIFF